MKIPVLLCLLMISLAITAQEPALIPKPVKTSWSNSSFTIDKNTVIKANDSEKPSVDFLNDYLDQVYGIRLKTSSAASANYIKLSTKRTVNKGVDGKYSLEINNNSVNVEGENPQGVFYGMQTLLQLLPVEKTAALKIPGGNIEDYPRFQYRGMHLDVSRHFFSVEYVKKYIDYIAMHKMNYFHWHLTDDQGWRIEIKKYPKLTEMGSCRNGTIIGRYPGKGNDSTRYCGYYTQEQIKDVIKYAADRYITILPEIEMPGHASAALTSYSYLGCTGGPYQVQQTWGVFNDVFCAGNDSTFRFLQDVIDEVVALFPSAYIHIGGDECPKVAWKKCPKCQKRMKDNNLKDEHELQSYFIQRMEKYINSKGKQVIGWDEILEGGLAPNAAVMSWRGEKGGIAAAKLHHTVVMTPTTYVYFDYAQKKNEDSVVIGGFLPVETVYNYEPLPKELGEDEKKYIIGAQANIWTEYVANPAKLEYMIFPRMSAISEVFWSPADKKDWKDFEQRLPIQFKRYELWNTHYSKAFYDLKASIIPSENNNGISWKLETRYPDGSIKIHQESGTSGKPSDFAYTKPIDITGSGVLSAQYILKNDVVSQITQSFQLNKATGKKISLSNPPAVEFPGNGGAFGLVNGVVTDKYGNFSEWLGWPGGDMEAIIDLGKADTISKVNVHTLDQKRGRYYQPSSVEIFSSPNGTDFTIIGKTSEFVADHDNIGNMTIAFTATLARYIKVLAKNSGIIPEGQPGAGNPSRMLIDEIQVN